MFSQKLITVYVGQKFGKNVKNEFGKKGLENTDNIS